jgi:hypothetical protein
MEEQQSIHRQIASRIQDMASEKKTKSSVNTAQNNVDSLAEGFNNLVQNHDQIKSGVPSKPKAKHLFKHASTPAENRKAGCFMSTMQRLDIGLESYSKPTSGARRYAFRRQKDKEKMQGHAHYAMRHLENYRISKERCIENADTEQIHEEARAIKKHVDEAAPEQDLQQGQRVWGTLSALLEPHEETGRNSKEQAQIDEYMVRGLSKLPDLEIEIGDEIKTYPSITKSENKRKLIRAADFYEQYT